MRSIVLIYGMLLCGVSHLFSQQKAPFIGASLSVIARPSIYMGDWFYKKETVQFAVTNSSSQPQLIKLVGYIIRDSVKVASSSFDAVAILRIASGTTVFNATDIFRPEYIEFHPSVHRTALKGGGLPPGQYTMCVEVYDPTDPIDALCMAQCKPFTIVGYEIPLLTEPANGATMQLGRPFAFKWKPVAPTPQIPRIARYKVLLFEILMGQDTMYAYYANKPLLEKFTDRPGQTQLFWTADEEKFNDKSTYIWTVQAVDIEGKPFGEPDGKAEPFILRFRKKQ